MSRAEEYKNELLAAGFSEGYKYLFKVGDNRYFWKTVMDKTAFAVNLKVMDNGIGIVCGFLSTAVFWTQDDWEFFKQNGRRDDDINLREYYFIEDGSDGSEVRKSVKEMYDKYKEYSKDEILDVARNKRKDFIARFTAIFKPLGFRKKGNMWYKIVDERFRTEFHIDKSPYSDTYEFDVSVMYVDDEGKKRQFVKFLKTPRSEFLDTKFHASHWYEWQTEPFEYAEDIVNKYLNEFYFPLCENPVAFWNENYKK